MNDLGGGLTAWMPSRQAATALPPVVAFGTATAALFAAGAGWHNAWRWWQQLDGSSRALLTVAVAVGLFLLTTAVMLLLPALTRVYEGRWPGARLRSAAARRQAARLQRLTTADSDKTYSRRYFLFPPRREDIRPTRLMRSSGHRQKPQRPRWCRSTPRRTDCRRSLQGALSSRSPTRCLFPEQRVRRPLQAD
jgi:hypothetical protein